MTNDKVLGVSAFSALSLSICLFVNVFGFRCDRLSVELNLQQYSTFKRNDAQYCWTLMDLSPSKIYNDRKANML